MKKIAVLNDLSGMGKCSLTAAIPVISVMGIQACPLPTAVLSAQTGFPSYYCDDYTDRMDAIMEEWKKMDFYPDGIYTGFLADARQADKAVEFIEQFGKEVCAAHILSEIFFWGLYPEDRENKVKALEERVQRSMDEKNLYTEKEVHELLDEDFYMSDDEKLYYEEKQKFEEKTKGVISRYVAKINDEIHQEYIHAVRQEYSSR